MSRSPEFHYGLSVPVHNTETQRKLTRVVRRPVGPTRRSRDSQLPGESARRIATDPWSKSTRYLPVGSQSDYEGTRRWVGGGTVFKHGGRPTTAGATRKGRRTRIPTTPGREGPATSSVRRSTRLGGSPCDSFALSPSPHRRCVRTTQLACLIVPLRRPRYRSPCKG